MKAKIREVFSGQRTSDGAGVSLTRILNNTSVASADPFLLLDYFGSEKQEDYIRGFPWHPHRGIETVTYMLEGRVRHEDSLGNSGMLRSGDVQWMSAGSGIIHQEMPEAEPGETGMKGFQLWVNLRSSRKMKKPEYQEYKSDQMPWHTNEGISIRLVAGELNGISGPVKGIDIEPLFADIRLTGNRIFKASPESNQTVLIYVFEGSGTVGSDKNLHQNNLAILSGGSLEIESGEEGMRFLFIAGNPINEPIAWGGPVVMNTQEELETAFREIDEGRFIK